MLMAKVALEFHKGNGAGLGLEAWGPGEAGKAPYAKGTMQVGTVSWSGWCGGHMRREWQRGRLELPSRTSNPRPSNPRLGIWTWEPSREHRRNTERRTHFRRSLLTARKDGPSQCCSGLQQRRLGHETVAGEAGQPDREFSSANTGASHC